MKKLKGTIISNKMQNTVVVSVNYTMHHPKYGKIIKKMTHLHAHNELEGVKIGDIATISQSRPYSKTVHFQTVEIVSKSPVVKNPNSETQKIIKQEESRKPSQKVKNSKKKSK